MQLHRRQNHDPNWEITFERENVTGFYEHAVASRALSLDLHDQEVSGIKAVDILTWAYLSRQFANKADLSVSKLEYVSKEQLKITGTGLYYLIDNLPDEIIRQNYTTDRSLTATRQVEADMARKMLDVIENRVTVPRIVLPYGHKFISWFPQA